LLEEQTQMRARPIISRRDVFDPIRVGRELVTLLESRAVGIVRIINSNRLAAVFFMTVKHGTSVGPSPI
jgi:hypothetical protein